MSVFAGPPDRAIDRVLDVEFENGVILRGVTDIDGAPLARPGLLTPAIFWTIPDQPGNLDSLKVTVQLLDGGGNSSRSRICR